MSRSNKKNTWLFNAWFVSVVATTGSLYLSEFLHFVPCSLCWYQRIFMFPLTILLGIATFRNDTSIVSYAKPLVIIGGCISIFHIYTQEFPQEHAGPFCGPDSCTEDVLNAFGFITVPMLALTAFVLIFISLLLVKRSEKK